MDPNMQLFSTALGLTAPWYITEVEFDEESEELHVSIDFMDGAEFSISSESDDRSRPYDTRERRWRHLDFWQHKTYLTARVPRIRLPDGSVKTIEVPWARKGSGFTLLFEASALVLLREMPVAAVARKLREHDTRIWRLLHHHVDKWKPQIDMSRTRAICVDETASKRGHNYITLVIDGDTRQLIYADHGRDKSTLFRFALKMREHGGDPSSIRVAAIDMGNPYKGGIRDYFPNAVVTFDRFHVAQWMNKAVDQVRRKEAKTKAEIKGTRFLWLKRHDRLTQRDRERLSDFMDSRSETARAYQLKTLWEEFYKQDTEADAKGFLKAWVNSAIESKILPMMKVACSINFHWKNYVSWVTSRMSTAINEGVNSLVQAVRNRARGYRNTQNFIDMCYFLRSGMPILST
jgi:transposase